VAQEHNALKYGGLPRAAARGFGLGDDETGLSRLGETLQLTANMWERPEWAILRGERLWQVNASQGAVAAELASVGVSCPTGTRLLTVVTRFLCDPGAAALAVTIRFGANFAFDATGNPSCRDTRRQIIGGLTGVQTVSFANSQAANVGSLLGQIRFPANTADKWLELGIVLTPGFFFAVEGTAVNTALNATLVGYERQAFPGELERA
jgi:hypothetical protein